MAVLTRTNYIPNTLIESAKVNVDFNQLVDLLSGVSTTKDALIKFSDAANPVLRVDQLGAGPIQQWLQNSAVKSQISNAGNYLFNQSGGFIGDQNGNEYLKFTTAASAVNEITATNAATGAGPSLAATGGDANIPLNINSKGTSNVVFNGQGFLSNLGKLLLPAGIGSSPSSDQISNFGTYFVDQALRQTPANTNETDFSSKTMSINVLGNDGDFLLGITTFFTAGNANTKRYRVYFNGTAFLDTTALALNGARAFVIYFIQRLTGGAAANCIGMIISATSSTIITQGQSVGATFSNTIIVKSTGQNGTATANDLSQDGFILLKGSV